MSKNYSIDWKTSTVRSMIRKRIVSLKSSVKPWYHYDIVCEKKLSKNKVHVQKLWFYVENNHSKHHDKNTWYHCGKTYRILWKKITM